MSNAVVSLANNSRNIIVQPIASNVPRVDIELHRHSEAISRASDIRNSVNLFFNTNYSINQFSDRMSALGGANIIVEPYYDTNDARAGYLDIFNVRNRATIAAAGPGLIRGDTVGAGGTGVVRMNMYKFIRKGDGSFDSGGFQSTLAEELAHATGMRHANWDIKGRAGQNITENDYLTDIVTIRTANNRLLFRADVTMRRDGKNETVRWGEPGYPSTAAEYMSAQVQAGIVDVINKVYKAGKRPPNVVVDISDIPDIASVSSYDAAGDTLALAVSSSIGQYLFRNVSPIAAGVLTGTLQTAVQQLAQAVAVGGFNKAFQYSNGPRAGQVVNGVLDDLGFEFVTNVLNAGVGTVSSLLSLELGRAIGVGGFGGELLQVGSGSIISHVASNAINIARFGSVSPGLSGDAAKNVFHGLNGKGLFSGGGGQFTASNVPTTGVLTGAISSFIGAKLGSLIISPVTSEGALFSAIGSTVGSIFGGANLVQFWVKCWQRALTF